MLDFYNVSCVCWFATHKNNPANVYCGSDRHYAQTPACYHVICPHCNETVSIDYDAANIIYKAGQHIIGNNVYKCPYRFNDFLLPESIFETDTSSSPAPYVEESTTQASNRETIPYPVFLGRGSSYETESWSAHKDYAKEWWGKNWWAGYYSYYRYYYRKTDSVQTYQTHHHYHWT